MHPFASTMYIDSRTCLEAHVLGWCDLFSRHTHIQSFATTATGRDELRLCRCNYWNYVFVSMSIPLKFSDNQRFEKSQRFAWNHLFYTCFCKISDFSNLWQSENFRPIRNVWALACQCESMRFFVFCGLHWCHASVVCIDLVHHAYFMSVYVCWLKVRTFVQSVAIVDQNDTHHGQSCQEASFCCQAT